MTTTRGRGRPNLCPSTHVSFLSQCFWYTALILNVVNSTSKRRAPLWLRARLYLGRTVVPLVHLYHWLCCLLSVSSGARHCGLMVRGVLLSGLQLSHSLETSSAFPQPGDLMLLCSTTAIASALLVNPPFHRHLTPGFIVPSLALSIC